MCHRSGSTKPPITNSDTLDLALQSAAQKAHCDYAQFLGAGAENTHLTTSLAPRSAGLKMYLDQTYGPLRLDHMSLWMEHFRAWPEGYPIVAHAEDRSIAAILFIAHLFDRSVHIAHVARKEEIILIGRICGHNRIKVLTGQMFTAHYAKIDHGIASVPLHQRFDDFYG